MNLFKRVDDPSFRAQETVCNYITMYTYSGSSGMLRAQGPKQVISRLIEQLQRDDQAAATVKKWAYLAFQDVLSDEHSFEVSGSWEELCKAFLEYQALLSTGKPDEARRYHEQLLKKGISAINLKEVRGRTQQCTRTRDNVQVSRNHSQRARRQRRKLKASDPNCQAETAAKHIDAGDTAIAINSNPERGSRSTKSSCTKQPESLFDPLGTTGKPSKRSASKKAKKRKARSQKALAITASESDASEEDTRAPFEIPPPATTSSISHRSKRVMSHPCRQPYDLTGANKQADKTSSTPRIGLHDTASLTNIKGRRGTEFPPSGHKQNKERTSNIPSRLAKASTDSGRSRRIEPNIDTMARTSKRLRRASAPAPDGKTAEVSEFSQDSMSLLWQQSIIQEPLTTAPISAEGNIRAISNNGKKRIRVEVDCGYVASDESTSASPRELLGPDRRPLRPVPKKICDRQVAFVNNGMVLSGVLSRAASCRDTGQHSHEASRNGLAALREDTESGLPDWTQDREYDTEWEGFGEDDQGEVNDDQVVTASSVPSTVTPKLPLPARPHVWAHSRQEICESLEYFRCYHGGVYSKNDIVKGYLLGAYSASRDIFHHDGKLIISHGGGKSESIIDDRRAGTRRYQKDNDQEASDKSVRALLKTWRDRLPIALLADDKYAHFPYDLTSANYTYVVLGFYWISHAWAECQSARDGSRRIVRWKFAFQWCEGQGDPWWAPRPEMTDISSGLSNPSSNSSTCLEDISTNINGDASIRCDSCREESPFVYKQGWICLNPGCDVFWSIDGKEPEQLDYREEFLKLSPRDFQRLPSIMPTRVTGTAGGVTTTHVFTRGLHCTECGRLSCRFKWEYWECSNCRVKHVVDGRIRSPKEFWNQRPSRGFLHAQLGKDSEIICDKPKPINLGEGRGFTMHMSYILPHGRGKIHLILGTPLGNVDADNIFEMYQRQGSTGELKLRRYPLRNHRARGSLLTNYFSQNSGEPYQYVGGTGNTVPFHAAPECVRRALALIKERSGLALHTDIPFNEILSAAYMERQKMSFHSDSEKELGPIVASLSLGSAALMHFRSHVNVENPSSKNKNAFALTLALRHGDIMVMEGDGVQKYYEHTVIPMNFRIAATARCIGST